MMTRISFSALRVTVGLFLFLAFGVHHHHLLAQEQSQYDYGTPPQHAGGLSSIGSYSSADLGTVNLANGSLNIRLPLVSVGGRGFSIPLTLNYSSKVWSADRGTAAVFDPVPSQQPVAFAIYDDQSAPGDYFQRLGAGWTIGAVPTLFARGMGVTSLGGYGVCNQRFSHLLVKLTLIMPDGGEIELRDDQTNGAPLGATNDSQGCPRNDGYRGTRWHATDGSGIIFIADVNNGVSTGNLTGTLITADGTRYRFQDNNSNFYNAANYFEAVRAESITDRNGNRIGISHTSYPNPSSVTYTDQLGRTTTVQFNAPDPANTSQTLLALVTFTGFNNQTRYMKLRSGVMNQNYRAGINPTLPVLNGDYDPMGYGYSYQGPHTSLFAQSYGSASERIDDRQILTELELPDGRKVEFRYNEFGEVAEVRMPTGGRVEYDYAYDDGLPTGNSPAFEVHPTPSQIMCNVSAIDRAVTTRRIYGNGSTLDATWTYDYTATTVITQTGNETEGYTDVAAQSPTSGLLLSERHFFMLAKRFLTNQGGTGYQLWSTGLERRMERRTATGGGGTVIAATEQDWSQRTPVSWSSYTTQQIANDNRVTETRSILDTGAQSRATTTYDQFNNPTDIYEYDFGGALLRRTVTSYVGYNPANGVDYTSDAVRQLRLPASSTVYNASGGQVANSEMRYDEPGYPVLTYGSVIGWVDPYTTARGNATTVRRWLDTTGGYLETHAQYDQVGNPRKSWDALGRLSEVSYSATYHYAYPTQTTSPIPDPTGQQGTNTPLTASSVYDFSTGLVTSTTDANSKTTTFQYNDPLNRLTRIDRPDGGWTRHTYGQTANGAYVETFTRLDAAREIYAAQFADGLGRPSRSFAQDGSQYQTVDTQYDGLGRVMRVSNPYYSSGSGSAVNPSGLWTTSSYDLLGRVTAVTTPDNAAVTTSYSGNTVTVTDQAGKSRRSVTDALGRLVQVIEDPAGLNLSTEHLYDALGNLRRVTQGSQTRHFMYDSLARLIRARNPEQTTNGNLNLTDPVTSNSSWTISYAYDANGNLTSRVDARNVTTTYQYDQINRLKRTDYSDATPYTTLTYDFATNGRGRIHHDYESSVTGQINVTGGYDEVGRPTQRRTLFYVAGSGWTGEYITSRQYDYAGNVTSQTYPSGRTVSYQTDGAGRTNHFAGNLGDSTQRTYSTATQYDAASRVVREQFGTQTALYHKLRYNVRGQLFEVRLSTVNDADDANRGCLMMFIGSWDWGASGTSNNGNIWGVRHWSPVDEAGSSFTWVQENYEYDSLNRVTRGYGYHSASGHQYTQAFDYDRWGNRQINQSLTWGTGINNRQFTVDTNTNRLGVPSGQTGVISYDASGNQTQDSYSGWGSRTFDAESRMLQQFNTSSQEIARYTYDAGGRRTRKTMSGVETWYLHGLDGELVAEYTAGQPQTNPLKEYGYRNGELLVTAGQSADIRWLVTDHLGTPRMTADNTGSLAGISRHDYLPFGEELSAGIGGRTTAQGYQPDNIRQQFTGYERDGETGLDYAQARYYASVQGRFISVDPLSGSTIDPQSLNRYVYVRNNAVNLTDPSGLSPCSAEFSFSDCGGWEGIHGGYFGNEYAHHQREYGGSMMADQEAAYNQQINTETATNGNPEDIAVDEELSEIFTAGTGFVRGASSRRNLPGVDSHFRLVDGTIHTIHIYGNEAATERAGIYIPASFSRIRYEGGGTVSATNPQTGQVIGSAHVNINSQRQLNRNMRQPRNAAGSRYIGEIGGTGASARGNWHAHLVIYRNAASRTFVKNWLGNPRVRYRDIGTEIAEHLGNFRLLTRRR